MDTNVSFKRLCEHEIRRFKYVLYRQEAVEYRKMMGLLFMSTFVCMTGFYQILIQML